MKRFLLIDGSSLLSTSFYGSIPTAYTMAKTDRDKELSLEKVRRSPNGEFTNGVYTMMRKLEKILRVQAPSHICVAWDVSRDTFRREIYPDYKTTRPETPKELSVQFALAQKVLDALGISQIKIPNYEADDILGCLTKRYEHEINTVVLTKDRDALQLVSKNTQLWLMTDKAHEMYKEIHLNPDFLDIPDKILELTPVLVKHFYGVYPNQIPDLKGLGGDASDNIPGVKGVGPRSIIPLLHEFSTIENLYEYLETTSENEAKESIRRLGINRTPYNALLKKSKTELAGKEAAFLSKELSTILTEIPSLTLPELNAFEVDISKSGRRAIYQELGFNSMLLNEVLS